MEIILHSIGEIHSPKFLLINKPTIPIPLFFTLFIFVFCFMFVAKAQEYPVQRTPVAKAVSSENREEIIPLKIGDKIPDELWEMYFPVVSSASENEQYLSLGDFKDKLIILDFWATWCAPCISSLHKLDSLQKEFEGELMVVPTSYEPKEKVKKFFASRGWSLPTAFDEEILKQYFPYRSIPHQVWIKNGKVLAIPMHQYTNGENIAKVIRGGSAQFSNKRTVKFDSSTPLLIDSNGGGNKELLYQSIITKNLNTNTVGKIPVNKNGFIYYNTTALRLLAEAFSNVATNKNRIIYELNDSLLNVLDFGDRKRSGNYEKDRAYEEWLNNYTFSYNLTSTVDIRKSQVYKIVQNDLNTYFSHALGIYGAVQEREMDCFVVIKAGNINKLMTSGEESRYQYSSDSTLLINKSMGLLLDVLNTIVPDKIFLDHTEIQGKVDLVLPHSLLGNLVAANKYLHQYGLAIKNKKTAVDMVVIKEIEK